MCILTVIVAMLFRVAMSHLKRRRERWTVKWSFHGDRGKILGKLTLKGVNTVLLIHAAKAKNLLSAS